MKKILAPNAIRNNVSQESFLIIIFARNTCGRPLTSRPSMCWSISLRISCFSSLFSMTIMSSLFHTENILLSCIMSKTHSYCILKTLADAIKRPNWSMELYILICVFELLKYLLLWLLLQHFWTNSNVCCMWQTTIRQHPHFIRDKV